MTTPLHVKATRVTSASLFLVRNLPAVANDNNFIMLGAETERVNFPLKHCGEVDNSQVSQQLWGAASVVSSVKTPGRKGTQERTRKCSPEGCTSLRAGRKGLSSGPKAPDEVTSAGTLLCWGLKNQVGTGDQPQHRLTFQRAEQPRNPPEVEQGPWTPVGQPPEASRSKPPEAEAALKGPEFQGRGGGARGNQGKQTSAPEAQRAHPQIRVKIVD